MRKTREELIKTYSYWNEDGHDIVETLYGDIPHIIYNKKNGMIGIVHLMEL